MNKYLQQGLLTAIVVSLAACGGSGGGGSKTSSSASSLASSSAPASSSAAPVSSSSSGTSSSASGPAQTLTGVFLDSAVAGIGYRTETKSGVTNSLGEFDYVEGENVIFFIGDLELPPAPAKGVVTPADIAAAKHDDNAAVAITKTNILQLLQTLDEDGDPSNGIQLSEAADSKFKADNLPDITSVTFDTDVVAFLPEGVSLVSESDALEHFDRTLKSQLLGSWVYSEGEGKRNVLTFIDSSRYIIIHEHDDEESQRPGSVEYGEYEWNPEAGQLAVALIGESDADGGLWSESNAEGGVVTHTLTVNGADLTLGTPTDGQAVFTRIIDSNNPIIGGWGMYEVEDDNLNVLTFLSATEYVIAHTNNQESYAGAENQPLSGEFGTYTLTDGRFRVTGATVDTDGEGGLYNADSESDQLNEALQITPWGDLLFEDDDEGSFSFMRLGSFVANLQDYSSDNPLGTVLVVRDSMGFSENYIAGKSFTAKAVEDGSNTVLTFNFYDDVNEDGEGTGTLAVDGDEGEDGFDITWGINSTATVMVKFVDGSESFTLAISKLVSSNSDTDSKVLMSLESQEESSLWESRLQMINK